MDLFKTNGSSPPKRRSVRADLLVHGHGSIYLLRPTSRRGRRWVDMRIISDRPEWAGAIVVEHRYVADIVRGALDDGLRVR